MSIIYEALKKAERERVPPLRGLPLRQRGLPARRRWRALAAVVAVGLAAGGGMWAWMGSAPGALARWGARPDAPATTAVRGADAEASRVEPWPAPATAPEPRGASAGAGPMSAEAAWREGKRAEDAGRWEEAVQRYQQAIALDPGAPQARNDLGRLYVRLNRVAAAIEEFRRLVASAPNHAVARNNLGSAYLLGGQEHSAIQEFLEAVRLDGAYVTPYYNLASVYARRGDAARAAAFLTKALALEPAVLAWVREDPDFAGVRDSPEFQRLRRVRMAQP
jgi:tetratricopeptide (TPR) repeat protein